MFETVNEDQLFEGIDCSGQELFKFEFISCRFVGCNFTNCDLTNTIFRYSILEKADFRKAVNYQIDPEVNKIKKARFSLFGVAGLLAKYEIYIEA